MKERLNIIGIIPARMASSRFPGKPLAKIAGIPMVGHVYFRSKMSAMLNDAYIATCDKEIADYAASIGAKYMMTADTHERASDRTAEAMLKVERNGHEKIDIAVMIQGDEPLLDPGMVDEALRPIMGDENVRITNLMGEIKSPDEFNDPNVVKVVTDRFGDALYFSREPIPSGRKHSGAVPMRKQICVVPFRRGFLLEYTRMPPTPLEMIESVDMMRILENGLKVRMVLTKYDTKSVDTKEDLAIVEKIMAHDRLFKIYENRRYSKKVAG